MGLAEATGMLKIARRDHAAAAGMLDGEIFEEVIWGFQLQQAVEKALKAWLYLLDQDVLFTHNLTLLLQLLQDHGLESQRFCRLRPTPTLPLNSATTKTRNPSISIERPATRTWLP